MVVNHAGSVLLTEPLELAENGRLMLTEEEGLNFVGGFSTLAQFLQEQKKDRHTEEVEAESISYAVCKYFGIETGENSFGYIASWSPCDIMPLRGLSRLTKIHSGGKYYG